METRRSGLGLTALLVSIVGSVLACIAQTINLGWVLLAVGFILGIAGVLRSGPAKKTSIVAMVWAVAGAIVSAGVVFFSVSHFLVEMFWNLLVQIFGGPRNP
jgi:hypothetical protein